MDQQFCIHVHNNIGWLNHKKGYEHVLLEKTSQLYQICC